MEILKKVILDNTVGHYLLVIGVVLFFRLFRQFLSQPFALSLYFLVKRIWKQTEKKAFLEMMARPLGWLITILAGLTAISSLHFPSAWDFSVLGLSLRYVTGKIMVAAIILTLSWFLSKMVNFTALVMEKKALMKIGRAHV
mgnify:CR=1 FL=1